MRESMKTNMLVCIQLAGPYLFLRRMIIMLYLLFSGSLVGIVFLSRQSLDALLYGVLLNTILLAIIMLVDYLYFIKKHIRLKDLSDCQSLSDEQLPQADSLLEEDYHTLLQRSYSERRELVTRMDNRMEDIRDYYTLWTHQIKTPIAAMKLLLEDDQTKATSQAKRELTKIENYVTSALTYARLDDITTDFSFEAIELDEVIKPLLKKYATFFISKKLTLKYDPLEASALSDRKWLAFILDQILSNALKYTHEGSVSIYMDPWQECSLVIEDTGIGINPEDLPRIFERGFTGYNGHLDRKSTGIGLYLTKEIASRLSHRITVTSEPGKGSKVTVHFTQI